MHNYATALFRCSQLRLRLTSIFVGEAEAATVPDRADGR